MPDFKALPKDNKILDSYQAQSESPNDRRVRPFMRFYFVISKRLISLMHVLFLGKYTCVYGHFYLI